MQGGNVGADRSLQHLRLTDVDPFGSLGLQEGVEDLDREKYQGNAADESKTYFILRHELRG
jgi:hypothetical protein